MPALVSISTHISKAYLLGLAPEVGVCLFGDLFWGSLFPLAPISEPTWALCIASVFLSGSVDIEADNAPSLEGCKIGVTDSSPVDVVGELTCLEGLLFFVTITSNHVWDGILS